ncbi:MAG: hypothetical protein ABI462_04915 [Ignavibacteria bacterium]
MAKVKKIKLTELLINTENYRFESVASQKEAIEKMLEDQGDKLFNLAEDIILNGLNPNDKIQVVVSNHDNTKYNVLEGNRRTVSLKLLHHPDLIDNSKHTLLKKKFKHLHDKNKTSILKEVECTVYDVPSEADKWIKLKHAGQLDGKGTVTWNAQQVDRFEEKVEGKSSLVLQTIKMLEKSAEAPRELISKLPILKSSNLERLISDPQVRVFLGIDMNNGIIQSEIEQKEVVKGLTQIVKDLLDSNFKVQKIYTKEDRQDYIKNFPKQSIPNKKNKAKKPWQFNESSTSIQKSSQKKRANPKERNNLIPKNCILKINNAKVNSIYHELQNLPILKFPNVAATSFRVFIEMSMDCFIEENKITTKDGSQINNNCKLLFKITEVANYLENNQFADKHICKGIRIAASNKNDLLGIETLHAYVHNSKFSAIPSNLITSWDNIQQFLEIVWENIK